MKKIVSIALCLAMLMSFTACTQDLEESKGIKESEIKQGEVSNESEVKASKDVIVGGLYLRLKEDQNVDTFREKATSLGIDKSRGCHNYTPNVIAEHSDYQIFNVDDNVDDNSTNNTNTYYLLYKDNICKMDGLPYVQSFALADINGDNEYELYIIHPLDSGISHSKISYFDPATNKFSTFSESIENKEVIFSVNGSNELLIETTPISSESDEKQSGSIKLTEDKITLTLITHADESNSGESEVKASKEIFLGGLSLLLKSDTNVDTFRKKAASFGIDKSKKCYNVTPKVVAENSDYQVFNVDGIGNYLLYKDTVYKTNSYSYILEDFALADINGDGEYEFYFGYSLGSGIRHSMISYFDPATNEELTFSESFTNKEVIFSANGSNELLIEANPISSQFGEKESGSITLTDDKITLNLSDKATIT